MSILPLQMLISRIESEPYPALYQPSFAGAAQQGEVASVLVPEVAARHPNGGTSTYTHLDLLDDVRITELLAFRTAFPPDEVDQDELDSEAIEWLRERLEELGDDEVISAAINWIRHETTLDDAREVYRSVESHTVVEFDP